MEGGPPNLVPLRDPVDVIIMNRLQSDDHTPLNHGPLRGPYRRPYALTTSILNPRLFGSRSEVSQAQIDQCIRGVWHSLCIQRIVWVSLRPAKPARRMRRGKVILPRLILLASSRLLLPIQAMYTMYWVNFLIVFRPFKCNRALRCPGL